MAPKKKSSGVAPDTPGREAQTACLEKTCARGSKRSTGNPPAITWNYRVIRRKEGGEWTFGIYEVHYRYHGNDDEIEWVTLDSISPMGMTEKELIQDLERMIEAFDRPVLEWSRVCRKFSWGKRCS